MQVVPVSAMRSSTVPNGTDSAGGPTMPLVTSAAMPPDQAFNERRHDRFGRRVVAGDERVHDTALGQAVAEDGVERLHDVRVRRGGPGDLLRDGGASSSASPSAPASGKITFMSCPST